MGGKKRFNWKGRQVVATEIDNSEVSKIKVTFDKSNEKYDESNQLVLPSKKRVTKKRQDEVRKTKLLSKTQRKKLEKIVQKKKKKANRSNLLEALSQVQVPLDELNQLTSVASVQTKGLKRHFSELENENNFLNQADLDPQKVEWNSISGSKRRKRILAALLTKKLDSSDNDPNIVGFDDSASSDSDDNYSDQEKVKIKETNELDDTEKNINFEKSDFNSNLKQNSKPEIEIKMKDTNVQENFVKTQPEVGLAEKKKNCSAVFIPVDRDPKIQEERLKLPVLAEEQPIMEKINENSVVIIAGETGSGKTTQIPQFLFEAGYARNGKMIGITQPRRVAAISMSKRVAEELNLGSNEVSYLIRFEGNVTENTKIKFMTDGVLLKEVQSDFILSKYSVVILDEAHERSVYTDILIGLLSRIVRLRNKRQDPLKLIIMSATLKVEDFTENVRLFKTPPPSIKIEARQYPVSIHFNKKTPTDYLKACFLKACQIHTKLPSGGILIFVTGQQEVNYLVRKLRRTFPLIKTEELEEKKPFTKKLKSTTDVTKNIENKKNNLLNFKINLDKYSVVPVDDTEVDLIDNDEDLEILNDDFEESKDMKMSNFDPLWVLPMYSLLPTAKQAKVFAPPPEGSRLCVVSTNVAETSLTIPNIKYVVDSGKTKTKLYDKTTGVTSFHITWCSKASANQRAGRAGRVGPGHCYRLYSSAVFNDEFPAYSTPEIQQKPVDDLILQMKSMNIIKVCNFPFPTSPDIAHLESGEKRLITLGALEKVTKKNEWNSKITKLGVTMASFPVSPRFAKMLALSYQHDLLQYSLCIVAALSVPEVLLNDQGEHKWFDLHRSWAGVGNSLLLGDIMVLLHAVGASEFSRNNLEDFCLKNGLRLKAINEIRKLRFQLTNQINLNIPDLNLVIDPSLKPPTDIQAKLLRQILLSGLVDHVAHKVNLDDIKEEESKRKWRKAYQDSEIQDPVFLHSSSVLKKQMPEWVVYQEVYETKKLYMRGVTAIEPEWLPIFAPSLCNLSEPLEEPPPKFDSDTGKIICHVNGTFGKAALQLPTMAVPFTNTLSSYKWFAKFFLEGEVCPKLKQYCSCLLSSPEVMTKTWAKLQSRTEIFLKALVEKEVNTRDQLLKVWENDSYYLLMPYKSWLPESAHDAITSMWPPI